MLICEFLNCNLSETRLDQIIKTFKWNFYQNFKSKNVTNIDLYKDQGITVMQNPS